MEFLDFEVGPFTVLFGKNNVGKTNVLEAWLGMLNPGQARVVRGTLNVSTTGLPARCTFNWNLDCPSMTGY